MSTVEQDLLLARKYFEESGWRRGLLLDLPEHALVDSYDSLDDDELRSCGGCMSAAVGIVTEGVDFLRWAGKPENYDNCPIDWEWSRRGLAVFTALYEHRPTDVFGVDEDPSKYPHIVSRIVSTNDAGGMTQEKALAWIDKTIAAERGK